MRITFLLAALSLGGGNRVVSIYADRLRQLGHEVVVVVSPPRPSGLRDRFMSLLDGGRASRRMSSSRPPSHFDPLDVELRVASRPGRIEVDDLPDADVLVATWWETAEWALSMPASKGAKAYFVQHHEVFDYLPVERARRTYTAPLHRIAVAQWLVDVLANDYGDHDVDLVPNAVDHAVFFADRRTKQRRPTVGFLSSPASFKGVDVTLDALRRLRSEIRDLRILSFGGSPADNFGDLLDLVEFHWRPTQSSIRELYASCDVWITASRSEGFNLPAMEAMACRTPVVSTLAGWPMEAIVDGKNGYLVAVDDRDRLAERVRDVLSLPAASWEAMSEHAYATVAERSWHASADAFERALRRAHEKRL